MEGHFITVKDDRFLLTTTQKIIKADQYLQYCQAASILQEAQEKSRALISDSKTQFEENKKIGYEQGYAQGQSEGKHKMARELTDAVVKTQAYLNAIEDVIIDTVISALKMILGDMGQQEVLRKVVVKTVRTIQNKKGLKLRVCPQQVQNAQQVIDELLDEYQLGAFIVALPDKKLNRGDCMLESSVRCIDVSLDMQLDIIKKALEARFAEIKKDKADGS